jgi:hypothetical protein
MCCYLVDGLDFGKLPTEYLATKLDIKLDIKSYQTGNYVWYDKSLCIDLIRAYMGKLWKGKQNKIMKKIGKH